MANNCNYFHLIQSIRDDLRQNGLSSAADEVYADTHLGRYEEDIKAILPFLHNQSNILEISPYTGYISIQLKKMGYNISIIEPKYFYNQLQARFEHYGIPAKITTFPHDNIPFPKESFDFVIFCETIEHFAFNPVPVLKQIHEVLKPGGVMFLTTPNQATLKNVLKLLYGLSVNESVSNFFFDHNCYDPQGHLNLGLHWREYSMSDLCLLLELCGFSVKSRRFRLPPLHPKFKKKGIRRLIQIAYRSLFHLWPPRIGGILEVVCAKE